MLEVIGTSLKDCQIIEKSNKEISHEFGVFERLKR